MTSIACDENAHLKIHSIPWQDHNFFGIQTQRHVLDNDQRWTKVCKLQQTESFEGIFFTVIINVCLPEKLNKKLNEQTKSLKVNKTCLKENLPPR